MVEAAIFGCLWWRASCWVASFLVRQTTIRCQADIVPEVVPGINIKETIYTVRFGIKYRFGPY
jgi:hypothetical protein